ncbi:MAG: CBS domain-containing protein, partial [Spirulinaceae cyanobacterium RM2_2_10]|nr:CBS domain-containing protein [Spirulinaceae cyanobacterium RM2_2_10]
GGLGALFNRGVLTSLAMHRRLGWPMLVRVGVVGLVAGVVLAIAPPEFRDNTGLREILMTGAADWHATAIAFAAHFSLTILAYGTGAPGGVFAPALLMGSALGYLVGTGSVALAGSGSEVTYALVGTGAFFTGVARVPVTAIVIVFELTADFGLVLPLMIGCGIAYLVGEAVFSGSLYQHLLEASGIDLKDEANNYETDPLARLVAADVMQRQVETLSADLTLAAAIQFFTRSNHRGFPVLDDGRAIGVITDSDLATHRGKSPQLKLRELVSGRPVTLAPTASLKDAIYLMDRYHLSHLPVVEERKLVGIVTRSDLIHAAAEQREAQPVLPAIAPSYVVYVSRSPRDGQGPPAPAVEQPADGTATAATGDRLGARAAV